MDLEGALVTLEAMGTQKKIAQHIRDRKAGYLLVLKANHESTYEASAHEAVEALGECPACGASWPSRTSDP